MNNNGSSTIKTEGNLNIGGVNTSINNRGYANKDNFNYEKKQEDIGSVIQSVGDTRLQAENITVKGSQISSEQGSTILSAQQKIDISEGRKVSDTEQAFKVKEKGTLSTTVRQGHVRNMSDEAIASTIDGKNVILDANNIDIRGSNVVSDELTQIQAKENVTIKGAENQYLNYSETSVKKSGLMSSGGIGFSVGKKSELTEQQNTQKTNTGSMVGSLNGNTNIIAGKTYQQTGSTVSSQQGDVNILAQQVNIEAAKEQSTSDYKHEMEQKGLTLAVNVPVVAAVQSVLDSSKQVGQSKNDRVNAMATANAGFDAYKAGQALGNLKDVASGVSKLADAANVSVSITYGEQKNTNFSHSESNTASQSQVYAGGKTNIVATGTGKDSNINIIGSDVVGKQGTHLAADNDVNIKAAEQNSLEQSGNKSAGWNAGVAVSYGSSGLAFGVTAGGNAGKGTGNGTETSYTNSHVGSKDSLTTISSGNATNIIGGQVQGKGIQIDANELNVESLQDKANYKSKQQNIEGQVTVGYGASASGSFSKSNVDANYASVNEQSGIFAGDDGYQINVKNNTDLKGAIITSTQKAEDLKKNSLDTGTLTYSDIRNVSEYDAKGIGLSGSMSVSGEALGQKAPTNEQGLTLNNEGNKGTTKSIGFGLDSDKDSSVTRSGINTSNITIRDEQGQQALTGKTAEQIKSEILTNVTTDTARKNSGTLKNNFDKDKVQSEINLQVDVTKQFGENAPKAVADYAQQQVLKQEALGNEEEAEKWREGGIYRIAMHTVIGALSTGSLEGTLTTSSVAAVAPTLNQIQNNLTQVLSASGMKTDLAESVVKGISSLALVGAGTAVGLNTASTATAVNVDSNNRQLHREEIDVIQKLAKEYAKEKGISEEEAQILLARGALYNIDAGWKRNIDDYSNSTEIAQYNQAYDYLLLKTANTTVSDLNIDLSQNGGNQSTQIMQENGSVLNKLETIIVTASGSYAGHLSDAEEKKAELYTETEGKGFTATPEDFKNKDVFLTNTLAGSIDKNSPKYNDKKEFMQDYAAIQSDDVSIWEQVKTSPDKDIGSAKGIGKGFLVGGANLLDSISGSIKGFLGFVADPVGSTEKAVDKANQIKENFPEITEEILEQERIAREKHYTTLALYDMQRDTGAKAEYEAQPYGELIGGAGLSGVGKKTVQSVGKAADEAVKNVSDHLTPKPATVAGTPDVNGGATTMAGTPDVNGGVGKTEVVGATMAAGYEQPQNPQSIYDPHGQRADLEAVHGKENVKSTTVVNDPYQRVNSNKEKGIEVIYDSYGNKAVKVEYKDPLTGKTKFANAAYDGRELPVFDDYAKYTTKIEKPVGYMSMSNKTRRKKEMELATLDLKSKIESGSINRNQFTSKQLSDIYKGSDKIEGYTWHHNSQAAPNNFQLLPEKIHDAVKHIGEGALSGGK